MSTYLYDRALVDKIKRWTSGRSEWNVLGPNEVSRLYEIDADNAKRPDAPVQLPLIAISRSRGFAVNNTSKRPLTYDGLTIDAIKEKSRMINAIPITISYQLDVYTRKAEEAELLVRNLIFNIINFPGLTVMIPNSGGKEHMATITLDPGVDDNSGIKEQFISGNMTRLTLTLSVSDAYLWDARERNNVFIDILIDTTMESTFIGSPDGGDTSETYPGWTNNFKTAFEPYKGTKMIVYDRNAEDPNEPLFKLVVGEDVTWDGIWTKDTLLRVSNHYAPHMSGKDLKIVYIIKEMSMYTQDDIEVDMSLAGLIDNKIVKTIKE